MSESLHTILIPNVLHADCHLVEKFYAAIDAAPLADRYRLDLSCISFVVPYGVLALVNGVRLLYELSQAEVELINIQPNIHSYLERVGFFTEGLTFGFCQSDPAVFWARSGSSLTVLELMAIDDEKVLDDTTRKARAIFAASMGKTVGALVVMVLSELCTNVLLHSGDRLGTILIQRCSLPNNSKVICVRVAVSDLGLGIRKTLANKHPHLDTPIKAIKAAFDGFSSRESDRGSLGLRSVAGLANENGGHVWIRSENAALLHDVQFSQVFPKLCYVPGTQVAVEFRVPVDDELDCG